ncbi:MAG: recombinase zinc beta ribbon domain-containing protein [Clostridium sp.]
MDKFTFDLIQDIKTNRVKSNYRGSRGQWLDSKIPNPFGSCLYCKDCHSRLTPIKRESSNGHRKYYICTTYNTKGKQYCSKAHLIEENNLMNDVVHYVRFCFDSLCDVIATYNMKDFESEKQLVEDINFKLQDEIIECKKQLRIILSQKIKDLSSAAEHEDLIHEIYDSLQNDILSQIHKFEIQLHELTNASSKPKNIKEKLVNALDIVNKIIEKGVFDRRDIEILIERIDVDENGLPEIELKYGLSDLIQYSPAEEMNKNENKIIYTVLKLILEDTRAFTSAKYLSEKLTALGFEKSKKSVFPYIGLMLDMKVIEPCENPLKPYTIIMQQEEIKQLMELYAPKLHGYGGNRWDARNDF